MLGIQLAANTVALDMFVEWKSFLKVITKEADVENDMLACHT